jgi:hypothetical protein
MPSRGPLPPLRLNLTDGGGWAPQQLRPHAHHRTAPARLGTNSSASSRRASAVVSASGAAHLRHRAPDRELPLPPGDGGPSTLPLYERHAFRVEIRGRVPPDGPLIWAMLRPAKR